MSSLGSWASSGWVIGVAAAGVVSCSEVRDRPAPAPAQAPAEVAGEPEVQAAVAEDVLRCRALEREILETTAVVPVELGGPNRVAVHATAKGTPVVLERRPRTDESDPVAVSLRTELERSPDPSGWVRRHRDWFAHRPAQARAVYLREGYLWAEDRKVARALVVNLRFDHLFTDDELWLDRGTERLRLRRDPRSGRYDYATGPEAGSPAQLVLFDRVGPTSTEPEPPLHVDLRDAAEAGGFTRLRALVMSDHWIVGEGRYGDRWATVIFEREGPSARYYCRAPSDADDREVARAAAVERTRAAAMDRVRAAIDELVDEGLPFDEPRTEEGQQDGNLRPAWQRAYFQGRHSYSFNGDGYPVFDASGRPRPPQVCIDFVLDAYQRASGSWWLPAGGPRERVRGALVVDDWAMENHRSVQQFVNFAWDHPEMFDVIDLADEERIQFRERERFFAHLEVHADRYRPGDIVTIHGLRGDEYHYHSFIVHASDPVSGAPIWLAANAGRPRVRTWEDEMSNAPLRSIRSRVRPRTPWLDETLLVPEAESMSDVTTGDVSSDPARSG